MAWRSFVQYRVKRTFASLVTCCGAFIFIVSDAMVVWDKEKGLFHLAPFWIMVTYYAAQLFIAFSAI
jgi:YhhN family